jgi:uncharacterized protein (DUF2336 family)
MKDANPHIFRSLETAAGSAEFDTIVTAAVSTYGALRKPSETQARDFARLVLPVWDRLKPQTKRALGASLSHSTNVPRGLVEKLFDEPIEIAAPFLVSSPVLTPADRLRIAQDRDLRLRRVSDAAPSAVERSTASPASVAEPAAEQPADPIVQPGGDEKANRRHPPREEPATIYEPGKAAAAVRETLRRLVQPGSRSSSQRMTMIDLLDLAVRGDAAETLAGLADMAGIDGKAADRIAADETGERLAVALKAIGASDADAMTIIMMLKPRVGLDVAIFDIMARYYRALKRDDCILLIGGRRRAEAPSLEPFFQDVERPDRGAQPRAAFGRRTESPASSKEPHSKSA